MSVRAFLGSGHFPLHVHGWAWLLLLVVACAPTAAATRMCMVGVDVAPELSSALSAEDISGYVHALARQVNAIFGTTMPNIQVAWIRPITLGVYNSSLDTIAYYATAVQASTHQQPCVRLLLSSRWFAENHVGIAYVGSACAPGIAAVFNVDAAVVRAGDYAGAWAVRNDAALTAAHEIAHTYGIEHASNKFDFMYAVSVVSESAYDLSRPTMPMPCLVETPPPDFPAPCFAWVWMLVLAFFLYSKVRKYTQ
jgi:hypothetical protein